MEGERGSEGVKWGGEKEEESIYVKHQNALVQFRYFHEGKICLISKTSHPLPGPCC